MNPRVQTETAGKSAFTLVELMVVIGLMAMLGTISVTGYFAAARGMSDRGAVEDTRAMIRQAMQVCAIDQTPTAVLFYNHQTEIGAPETSVGSAVVIKMVGRISYVDGDVIVDEFADWNQSCPVATAGQNNSGNDKGVRFYRMMDLNQVGKGIDQCSSLVSTAVEPITLNTEYMLASGRQVGDFCNDFEKRGADNKKFSGTSYDNGNNQRWGHRLRTKDIAWKAGDAYGVEIGSLDLPKGYIYNNKRPSSSGKIQSVNAGALTFVPDRSNTQTGVKDNGTSPSIWAFRAKDFEKVKSIGASDLKDDAE